MANEEIKSYEYNKKSVENLESRWWTKPDKDIYMHLYPLVKEIEDRQAYRKVLNLRHARLYSNLEVMGLQAGMFSRSLNDNLMGNKVTLNVIASCVDTAASKIAKAKPRPYFLTEKGNWQKQEKAKKLTRYLDGAFQQMNLYPNMQRGFVDSGIFGTGEVKFYKEDGQVKCDRILTDEIIIDDADGIYGTPSQKHQVKYVSKDVLCSMFDKYADKIMSASSGVPNAFMSRFSTSLVRVVESWKLPSSKGSKDGKHVICVDNCTLFAKDYTKPYFPFVVQRWKDRITGYHGTGIAEELIGIQLEINTLLQTVQEAQSLMCVPRIWIENNSMVDSGNITNEVASVGKYTGQPPVAMTWPAMPPEVYAHIENLYKKAYEIIGISQLSATSKKPSGLDSEPALRTYQDIESDRFQLTGQRYEDAHLEAADIVIDLTKELAAEGKDPFVIVKNGKNVEQLRWKDVNLEKEVYEMRAFPTSLLPTTPAGKLQSVQELTQAGFIDKDMALSLLEFPDLPADLSTRLSAYNLIKKIIGEMLETGDYISPEPYMDLPRSLAMAQSSYLEAQIDDVEDSKLELLRRFMSDCKTLIDRASQQVTPASPMAPTAPQAVPSAPPVSELIPNIPQGAMNAGIPG